MILGVEGLSWEVLTWSCHAVTVKWRPKLESSEGFLIQRSGVSPGADLGFPTARGSQIVRIQHGGAGVPFQEGVRRSCHSLKAWAQKLMRVTSVIFYQPKQCQSTSHQPGQERM